MNWQYQTILFEFQKDGLLGDKYVDDEEMDKILNEQGEQGWELVSVTAVQEGLLTFFKRVRQQSRIQATTGAEQTAAPRQASPPPPSRGGGVEEQRPLAPKKKPSTIGEIKIS
ncbi:MAG: DUF4177 domain-containing protein [Desulfobulbaceae bacterium]